jgi:plastocyanin
MIVHRRFAAPPLILLLFLLLMTYWAMAAEKHAKRTYVCSEANPQATCNPSNTCGSASVACRIDVKRTADGASVTPNIPGAKGDAPFCVKAGTTITWQSSAKNTGFTVDFGDSSPFESAGAIIGGSDRSVSVVAKKPGCYKFTAGACNNKAIDGMCDEASSEIIVASK